MPDFIPSRDADFDAWLTNLVDYVAVKTGGSSPAWPYVPDTAVSGLENAKDDWWASYSFTLHPHTPGHTVAKNEARARAEKAARLFVRQFLRFDPVTNADRVNMGIPVRDAIPTPVDPPTVQPAITVAYPGGPHLLRVTIAPLTGSDPFDGRSDYGHAIHFGVMPQGGATVEQAAGRRHYLMREPASGAELAHLRFTRRKRDFVEFDGDEAGMRAFFCARYENQKGDHGPWGPVASAVIP